MEDSSLLTIIEVLRSQILEIHHSLEGSLLSQVVRKSTGRFKDEETRRSMIRISVTCIDAKSQSLVVEELSRLLSLANSLKTSFETISRANIPNLPSDLEEAS